MLRWKYAGPFLVVLGLLVLAGATSSWWIKWSLEKGGSYGNEAQVNIGHVGVGLFPLSLHILDIQVANPKEPFRNRVQIDSVNFVLNTRALLEKKYVIDTLDVQGISLNTPRRISGALSHPIPPTPKSKLTEELEAKILDQTSVLSTVLPDIKAPKLENLEAVKAYSAAIQDLKTTQEKWNSLLKGNVLDKEVQSLGASFKEMQKATSEPFVFPRDLSKVQTLVTQTQTMLQKTQALSDRVSHIQQDFQKDSARLTSQVSGIQKAAQSDVQTTLKSFTLKKPHFNFGSAYLMEPIQKRLLPLMDKVKLALYYKEKVSMPSPHFHFSRDPGEDIAFQKTHHLPKFWIKQIVVSGKGHQGERIEGRIQDICSAPLDIQRPLLARLSGTHLLNSEASFQFQFEQYPAGDVKQNTLLISVIHMPLKPRLLLNNQTQKISLTHGELSFTSRTTLVGNILKSHTQFELSPLQMSSEGISTQEWSMNSVLSDVLKSVHTLSVSLDLTGPYRSLNTQIQSNIDTQISAALDHAYQQKIAQAQVEVQKQIDAAVSQKRAEAEGLLKGYQTQTQAWITQQTQQLDTLKASVDTMKKQLENQANDQVNSVKKQLFNQFFH